MGRPPSQQPGQPSPSRGFFANAGQGQSFDPGMAGLNAQPRIGGQMQPQQQPGSPQGMGQPGAPLRFAPGVSPEQRQIALALAGQRGAPGYGGVPQPDAFNALNRQLAWPAAPPYGAALDPAALARLRASMGY